MSKSILPQYQPVSQTEPWTSPDGGDDDDSWQRPPPGVSAAEVPLLAAGAYPPRPAGFGDEDGAPVTYIFVPRWPVKGKQESVLGVLGNGKEATTAMVQRVFPALDAYPASRIEFLTPLSESSVPIAEDQWSRIMDEAWPRFTHRPPARLKVQVADGPGDRAGRLRRDILIPISIILGVTFAFGAMIGIIALFSS